MEYSKRLVNIIDNLPLQQTPPLISQTQTQTQTHNDSNNKKKREIENICKEFNIDEKINSIMTLYRLISKMKASGKKAQLLKQFMFELDNTVNNLEQKYYKQVLQNKCETNIKTEEEKEIYHSHKVLEAIMPYAVFYMLNNSSSQQYSQQNNNNNENSENFTTHI